MSHYVIPQETIWSAAEALVIQHGEWAPVVAERILDDPTLDDEAQHAWTKVHETVMEIVEGMNVRRSGTAN